MNIMFRIYFIFVFIFLLSSKAFALSVETHERINEEIARNLTTPEGFSLGDYLKSQLKFDNKVEEIFNGKKVWELIRDGGRYEDIPKLYLMYVRSLNHFHNPLTEQGFKGNCLESSLCESSIKWALEPLGKQNTYPLADIGSYSWNDVRDYYYVALVNIDKSVREKNFTQTFRGLGQLMHLVQDASVPAHVRNDFHFFKNYEDYAKLYVDQGVPKPTDSDFFAGTINSVASFIDTNTYKNDGSNPGDTLSNTIGLSEYTNANFFSEDTIFSPNYPNPSKVRTNALLLEVQAEDGKKDRVYYVLPASNNNVYRMAAYTYFKAHETALVEGWKYNLDDNVYQDYAALLLPRAVGYSAGALKYFFRGEINMVPESGQYVIENNSDESMSGIFSLYYDDKEGKRYFIESWNNIAINAKGKSGQLTFTEPVNPAPAEKGKYILVFQGKLGNEEGAVVGKVVNLQSEELILYVKNYTEYKTYNTKTKEVKPYKGILEGLKGNVIWREDGKALLGRYGYGYWYLIDLEKGTKHPVMDGNRYLITGGWKGQTVVMFGIDAYSGFKKILYWEGTADSGKFTQYNAPAGINFLTISPEGWGPAYGGPMIATSWDGGFVSYAGYYENDYYLVNFDTTNRVFSTVKVGMKQKTSGEIIWLCPEGSGVEPQTFTVTNYPILLSGESNSVRALYLNKETEVGAVSEGWNQKNSCYVPVSSYQNTKSNYSILGELTSEAQCSYTYNNTTKFYDRTCSTNNINIYPLYQALTKDGKQVIPFVKEEYTANNYKYWPQAFNKKASPCVFYGNETCPSGSIEIQRTWGSATTGMYSLVNINSKKDKVIGFVNTQLQAYSPYESKNLRTVFYVSNGEFHDITKENSDFVNSDFFMFIE